MAVRYDYCSDFCKEINNFVVRLLTHALYYCFSAFLRVFSDLRGGDTMENGKSAEGGESSAAAIPK